MVEEGDSSSAANTDLKFLQTLAGLYNAFDGITPLAYAARPSGPSITRVRPSQCEPGELIIITGKKLGGTQGNSIVHIGSDTFDSGSSRIEVWSNKEIRIRVPDYACAWFGGQDFKDQDVWVTVGGADSNMKTLKILKPASCTSTGGSGTYYFINNHLGYPRKLVDDNLTVVWSSSSQVFGLATINEDPDGNGQTVVNNIRFPGQYFDDETGLHYNYFRYYDPAIGRYLREDPSLSNQPKGVAVPYLFPRMFINPSELNSYSYVSSNPFTWIDPNGLRILSPKCLNKPKPWPNDSCPSPDWFIYNSHYCCEERCIVYWGLDKWYNWFKITIISVPFKSGNYIGCVIACGISSSAY